MMRSRSICGSLLLICLILPIFAESATKEKKVRDDAYSWYYKVGFSALQEIDWDWKAALSGWTIKFHSGRNGFLGLTTTDVRCVDIWVRPHQSSEKVAATIVHELAHAFDNDYLTPNLRKIWFVTRNLSPNTLWYPTCDSCSDYSFGSGDFAECVSWTLLGPVDKFRSRLGPPPNQQQQALIRRWLSSLPKTVGN